MRPAAVTEIDGAPRGGRVFHVKRRRRHRKRVTSNTTRVGWSVCGGWVGSATQVTTGDARVSAHTSVHTHHSLFHVKQGASSATA